MSQLAVIGPGSKGDLRHQLGLDPSSLIPVLGCRRDGLVDGRLARRVFRSVQTNAILTEAARLEIRETSS